MAIFTNDNKQFDAANTNGATIIAAGTKFKGELEIECHIHIDGDFEGNINSKNTVLVGKSGVVSGEINAQKVIVGGTFTGTVDSECVEILPNGKIDGTIICNELYIEKKGIFVGESKIKSKEDVESN
ncbi:polymer-forming cytoskeletal family protein [Helicobacter sp. 16-1353]|uniref:bactofilin family protein n=1 Tax=Helicobacter sp. 16-1353 TaxID=2004996 RepID=UPI000DCD8B88|nr:polymer-forming cytoskeletal protein [Helicobacter sp. 16-1353]RAX54264.1 polymer-forming cytoskeletal family protein [Helicobacter sp. 16-1353]